MGFFFSRNLAPLRLPNGGNHSLPPTDRFLGASEGHVACGGRLTWAILRADDRDQWLHLGGAMVPPISRLSYNPSESHPFMYKASYGGEILHLELISGGKGPPCGCLGYLGDYTAQFYGHYSKPS